MDLFNRLSIPEYSLHYLGHLEKKGRKESTIESYFYDLHMFFEWVKREKGRELGFDEWRKFQQEEYISFFDYLVNEKHYTDRTIHRIFTVLKRMALYFNSINKNANIPDIKGRITDYQGKEFTCEDFISDDEFNQLIESVNSPVGLSEVQLKHRHMIVDRNISIIYMMYYEGLTLNEVQSISMEDLNFIRNTMTVYSKETNKRIIEIDGDRKKLYYTYYMTIPEVLRPKWHSDEPFFCAFHFIMGRYRYVYNDKKEPLYPKRITEIGIQRMLQKEVKRAELDRVISSQHLRNTAILNYILQNKNNNEEILLKEVMNQFGFKKEKSVKRYLEYVSKHY